VFARYEPPGASRAERGVVMKKSWLMLGGIALILAGYGAYQAYMPFDSAYVAGCEDYLKDGLKAPSTYKRIDARETIAPISPARLKAMGGTTLDLPWETKYWLHTVSISYEAENSFGVPIRSGDACVFSETGDEPDRSRPTKSSKAMVRIDVSGAQISRIRRQQVEAGNIDNPDGKIDMDPQYPCCL